MVGWPVWGGFGANPLPTRYEREWKELKAQWQGGFPYSEGIFEDINKVLFASFYWKADTTADEALSGVHRLRVLAGGGRPGPAGHPHAGEERAKWEGRAVVAQGARPDGPGRRSAHTASAQAWRWRILFLRAHIDAQLYLSRGAMQGRVLHDAFQELTRIYHAQNAEPAVKPPQVDPTEPPVTVRPADFQGPELAEAYGRAVLSSKPMAYWRMGDVAGDVLKDASGNAHSAACEAGVEFSPPTGPMPANPAAVFWGGRISAAIDHLPDAYSVELWVRNDLPPTARPITAYFFSRGVDGPPGTAGGDNLGIGGTHHSENQGKLFFFNGTKCDQVLSGRTALEPGTWHHVVLVRQGQSISVYLDGGRNPEICGQAEIGYPAGCGQLFFGGRNDGFAPLEGKLDEVSVYNRALSADEIAAHYAASQPQPKATVATGLRGDPQAGQRRHSARVGNSGGQAAGGFAGKRRVPARIAQEHAIRHKRLRPGGVACGHGIAPGAHHPRHQVHSREDRTIFPVNGCWRPARTPIFGCCICTAAALSRGRADSISRWRLTSRRRPSVPCSCPTTGWRRSTAFPAGLEDCIRAHQWLIANGPAGPAPAKATFIAGDSAGGNLTLATLLALRDRRRPLPAGGIALSPTTDLTLASESLRTVNDPIISASTMPVFRDHYLGKTDPRNPLASPVFGDYRGLPPLLIQVGEHEMLRDDSVRVAKKARSDGIPVKLEVWPGMFHVFQSHEPLLPEGREAIDHAADFMCVLRCPDDKWFASKGSYYGLSENTWE